MAMIIGTMPVYACEDMQENIMMSVVEEASVGYVDMGSVNVGGLQKMVQGLENSGAEITGRTPGGSAGVLAAVNTSNNKPIFSLNSDDPGAKEAFSISVTFLVITTVMYLIDFLIKKLRDRHD